MMKQPAIAVFLETGRRTFLRQTQRTFACLIVN